jgi:glycosyltransferase involved in cell wall biosynthesis
MAAGVPYLAFDTYYYRELLQSGAGRTVPWLDVESMAQAIVELDRNREQLVNMVERSVAFASANTQEIWLERRLAWTLPSKKPTLA